MPKMRFMFLSLVWCVSGDLNDDLSFHRHYPLFKYREAKSELHRIKMEAYQVNNNPYLQALKIQYNQIKDNQEAMNYPSKPYETD